MGNFVENRPIQCGQCGFQVNGQEDTYNNGREMIHECKWVCNNCGVVVRCDEEVVKQDETKKTS